MKNQFYDIVSVLAIIAYFVPILIAMLKKLGKATPLFLFAVYWMLAGIVNVVDLVPGVSRETLELITVLYNMIDIPLVLGIIYLSTSSLANKKFIRVTAPGYLVLELVIALIKGIHYETVKYTLAFGLALVLIAIVWEISLYLQKIEHSEREKAMIFIHASLLFAYGTFIIIYIFDYFVTIGSSADNFLIYYISSLIAIIIAACGYLSRGANDKFARD